MIQVVKWDGRHEVYDRKKVFRTIRHLGAPEEVADKIIKRIEEQIYDGVSTKKILDLIERYLDQYEPVISRRRDLRSALGAMKPFDFEEYVRILLSEDGYEVKSNRVIQGFCVTHEIDGIARKNGKTKYLEVKNHKDTHTYTPFGVTLEAKAKWDDIQKGFGQGVNNTSFDNVLIVCNTRLTQHAKKYAECIGLEHIGWNTPNSRGIDSLITAKKLYPITILKSLSPKEHDELSQAKVITLNHLLKRNLKEVKIQKTRLNKLLDEAKNVIFS